MDLSHFHGISLKLPYICAVQNLFFVQVNKFYDYKRTDKNIG